jgi:hypothetical protein
MRRGPVRVTVSAIILTIGRVEGLSAQEDLASVRSVLERPYPNVAADGRRAKWLPTASS